MSNYALELSTTQFLVIIGIAVSGVAAFVNTYNAIAGINYLEPAVKESQNLQNVMRTRFIVFLVISILLIVVGGGLAFSFRNSENKRKVISYGLITAGILGLIYTLTEQFKGSSMAAKLAVSWIALIIFLAIGFFLSRGGNKVIDLTAFSDDFNL